MTREKILEPWEPSKLLLNVMDLSCKNLFRLQTQQRIVCENLIMRAC